MSKRANIPPDFELRESLEIALYLARKWGHDVHVNMHFSTRAFFVHPDLPPNDGIKAIYRCSPDGVVHAYPGAPAPEDTRRARKES